MTIAVTHLWRLLRWGRTLARHGALGGIERDPLTPPPVRRLLRVARFGLRQPDVPDYAAALQAIGPAAIKLGQALATRPDLVGDAAAANLLMLQDSLPPEPYPAIKAAIERALEAPIESLFSEIDEVPVGAASIAQVHRAVTTEGRVVAVKVLRPGIEEEFASALETYEWAAAHVELLGGDEAVRLRPRLVVAHFKQWTQRELDLQRDAASASELRENMVAEPGFHVPEIDWRRTARRVMTLEWLDGIKLSNRNALIAAGHDPKSLAAILVRAFLRQAVIDGYFHADLHQGNLFALPDGRIAAIDFGIMGRIDRQARMWLAEILPVKDISIGGMLDGLFSITRDFDMPTQPHLLLLQKTMVMEEGVATALDPDINMWETAEPFLKEWLRSELGPEAYYADRIVNVVRAFKLIPDLIRKIDASYPNPGAAPPPPPLADIAVVERLRWGPSIVIALVAAAASAALTMFMVG